MHSLSQLWVQLQRIEAHFLGTTQHVKKHIIVIGGTLGANERVNKTFAFALGDQVKRTCLFHQRDNDVQLVYYNEAIPRLQSMFQNVGIAKE